MKIFRLFVIVTFVNYSAFLWAGTTNVFLGKNICSKGNVICVKGTMDFNYTKGLMQFHGRVKEDASVGTLTVKLKGITRKNERFSVSVSAELQGKYSEVFNVESDSSYRLKGQRGIKWSIQSVSYR